MANGVVGLNATGGSTNLTIHLIGIAAAGIALTWEDFADLAEVTPLLTRIYPSGKANVNHFRAAGGMGVLIRELEGAGLLHGDARTVWGERLADYAIEPHLDGDGEVRWRPAPDKTGDPRVVRGVDDPFQPTGGLRVLEGPLGRAVIKMSAVAPERQVIEAPARVFHSQEELHAAFSAGEARPRRCRRRPLPGAEGDRHAGAAQSACCRIAATGWPSSPTGASPGRRARRRRRCM